MAEWLGSLVVAVLFGLALGRMQGRRGEVRRKLRGTSSLAPAGAMIMNDTLTITHRFIVNPLYRRYNAVNLVVRSPEQRVADRMQFLKRLPLFAHLSDAEITLLAQDFTLRRFPQGEAIFFKAIRDKLCI